MTKSVVLNCFNSKKTVALEPNALLKNSDNLQTSGVTFTTGTLPKNPLKQLWSAIKDILRRVLCGFSFLEKDSSRERKDASLEQKDSSREKIVFSNTTVTPEDLIDSPNIAWDEDSKQCVALLKNELEETYAMIENRTEISLEECQAMNDRFLHEHPFCLEKFDQTTNVQNLPLSKYDFDEETKDFLVKLEVNKNDDCSQLVKDFTDKIDLYKIYTKNEDVTKEISLIEILFKAGYTKVATGIVQYDKKDHQRIKKLRNIMANFLENMKENDFTPWKVHFIEMFVLSHGTAAIEFLPITFIPREYSVLEKINTKNGNSLLMELIRLGHYSQVLLVMLPHCTKIDDIFNFRNNDKENALDLIARLLKDKESIDSNQVIALRFLKNYLCGKARDSARTNTSNHVFSKDQKLSKIEAILSYSEQTTGRTATQNEGAIGKTEAQNFSLPQKKFFLQKLSLAGLNLSTIYRSKTSSEEVSAFFVLLADTKECNAGSPHKPQYQYQVEDLRLLLQAFPQTYNTICRIGNGICDPLCASIHFNRLDVVQFLLEEQRPTQLFMCMHPLEFALKVKRDIRPPSSLNNLPVVSIEIYLPVSIEIYRALLKNEQRNKDPKDYRKIVNNFVCTIIQAKEGSRREDVLPGVREEVFKFLLEEQFEWINRKEAIGLCNKHNADTLSQALCKISREKADKSKKRT